MNRETDEATRGGVLWGTVMALRPWSHCGSAHPGGKVGVMTRMLATTLAALLISAAPAYASGKDTGATPPPPSTEPWVDPCDGYWGLADIVNRTNGGCVGVTSSMTLAFVAVLPGWTYTVENGGGTKGRVQVSFLQPATGQTASIRVEPGKTDIR